MPDPKNYMDESHTYVRGYVRRKAGSGYGAYNTFIREYVYRGSSGNHRGSGAVLGGLVLLMIVGFVVVVMLWKAILIGLAISLAAAGLGIALIATIRIAKSRYPKLAFAPIPLTLLLVILLAVWVSGVLDSSTGFSATSPPKPAPVYLEVPPGYTIIEGPIVVERDLRGRTQWVVPLGLEGSDIVKLELRAIGVYHVPFKVSVLDPSNQILGSITGTVINPTAFEASMSGRYTLIIGNTSGDFRAFRLTYTIHSGD